MSLLDPTMRDWTGPTDERYFEEQARRRAAWEQAGGPSASARANGAGLGAPGSPPALLPIGDSGPNGSLPAGANVASGSKQPHEQADDGAAITWRPPSAGAGELARLLDDLVAHLRRYVWFSRPEQADAVALWIAHAHAVDVIEQSPILAITSPVKQSGKSRLLDVIETLVPQPWRIERPSEAVLYRKIERDHPTILMDEADTVFEDRKGQYEGIRAIFNAGNRRGTVVSRVMAKGKSFELLDFSIFGPKAIAGIGRFPETIIDRSIVIAMTRRAPTEIVERFRTRAASAQGARLRDRLAQAVAGVADVAAMRQGDGGSGSLALADDELPAGLDDRGQDNWESLLALARLAGGDWASRMGSVCLSLDGDRRSADDNAAITLLADLRSLFEGSDAAFLTTSTLLEWLHGTETSPWSEWRGGKPLSARGMARLLRDFGIAPGKVRDGGATIRGYSRLAFADAWVRYLPPSTLAVAATSATLATPAAPSADLGLVPDAAAEPLIEEEFPRGAWATDEPVEEDDL